MAAGQIRRTVLRALGFLVFASTALAQAYDKSIDQQRILWQFDTGG